MECTLCNSEFSCTENQACWCFEYPAIPLSENPGSCLCPSCLLRQMAQRINNQELELTDDIRKQIARLGVPAELKQGVDYELNSDGYSVLSRWYLLRRSYCCKNDCSNCPY